MFIRSSGAWHNQLVQAIREAHKHVTEEVRALRLKDAEEYSPDGDA